MKKKKSAAKRKTKNKKRKTVLGWREWVALPQLHVGRIKAKIDSGAKTSALHATQIEYLNEGNKRLVRFIIHPRQRKTAFAVHTLAELFEERMVKASSGHESLRPVVKTPLAIGKRRVMIELTLVNRDIMGFRMLIGRQALRHGFLIDSAASYLLGKPKKKVKKK